VWAAVVPKFQDILKMVSLQLWFYFHKWEEMMRGQVRWVRS